MVIVIYIFAILSLGLAMVTLAFVIFGLFGEMWGAPFVPTTNNRVRAILGRAKLKKGQLLVELGSGDGRFIFEAVDKYQVKATGYEIHPMLVLYSRARARLGHLKDIHYKRQNFYQADISRADVIFMFLLPKTLKKLQSKFLNESKKGAVIISHGFKIPDFDKYITNQLDDNYYPTYFYLLK